MLQCFVLGKSNSQRFKKLTKGAKLLSDLCTNNLIVMPSIVYMYQLETCTFKLARKLVNNVLHLQKKKFLK